MDFKAFSHWTKNPTWPRSFSQCPSIRDININRAMHKNPRHRVRSRRRGSPRVRVGWILFAAFIILQLATKHALSEQTISECMLRSEEHTSELQSRFDLVCRLLLEKK